MDDFQKYERIRKKYRDIPSPAILKLCLQEAGFKEISDHWSEVLFDLMIDLLQYRIDWETAAEELADYGFSQEELDGFKNLIEEFYPFF